MKKNIYISSLFLISFYFLSCSALQYQTKFPVESKFTNFKTLGVNKEDFIKKYGNPTTTGISKNNDGISESLYYAESLKEFIITTEFVFKNNKLQEIKTAKIDRNYQNELEYIKWQTEMNGLNQHKN